MYQKNLCLLLTASILWLYSGVASAATLKAGTPILLEIRSALSTKDAKEGQVVSLSVVSDVIDPETKQVLVSANTPAKGIITKLEKNGIAGKPGELALDIQSTQAIDGTLIPLTAQVSDEGDGKRGLAIGLAAVSLIVLWPMIFMIFKKGKDAEIPAGSKIDSFVRTNTEVAVATPAAEQKQANLSDLNQLEKLFELKQKGILTEQEFAAKKAELLGGAPATEAVKSPLEQLHALYQAGALSQAEYEAKKVDLLNITGGPETTIIIPNAAAATETPDYLKKYVEE